MKKIVVFGATSGIAEAVVREFLSQGKELVLIGRFSASLLVLQTQVEKEFSRPVPIQVWDVLDFENHAKHFQKLISEHSVQGLFFAAGIQFLQDECDRDAIKTQLTLNTNFNGPVIILNLFVEYFKLQKSGFISCISSVAGDRGRGKVLAYGAAKAGLSAYLEGLRYRLNGTGVFVQTIKPGWVKTRMTEGMTSPLLASPQKVAKEIVTALASKRSVVYTPFYWKYIMLIIKLLPEFIFKRLKF